ncbi:polymer-forming cytoskeletal protein [Bacillus shivajii]|uniref:bactofilin family protein n=1 Tax=Bacillus shivajii TaxID=1983719 RepID=UPI001CF99E6D|nr:polymer-forming cytoskeletal protein [Bacillus shivajii]UCZ53880.1 polymer-forming cytoskeletal protein [Bacillus shivajii]
MFSNKKDEKKLDEVSTVIGEETTFTGTLEVNSSIRIDGKVYGDVKCNGDVTVGQEGYIEKQLTARNLFLAGKIQGDVKIEGKIHIYDSGSLDGKAEMNTIVIDENGHFNGECVMTGSQDVAGKKENSSKKEKVKEVKEQA